MRRRLLPLLGISIATTHHAQAAELEVMSAGAMEPGLAPALQAFRRVSGQAVQIRYATAPALQQALAGEVHAPEEDPRGRLQGERERRYAVAAISGSRRLSP